MPRKDFNLDTINDGPPPKSLFRRIFGPVVFLIAWLALIFSLLFREIGAPDWVRIAIVGGFGIFGAVVILRSIRKTLRDTGHR